MTSGPDYGRELPRLTSAYGQSPWAPDPVPPITGRQPARMLGIVSVVSYLLAFMCLATAPGVLCAPVAWALGAHAMNQIDHSPPGRYGNRRSAVRGSSSGSR